MSSTGSRPAPAHTRFTVPIRRRRVLGTLSSAPTGSIASVMRWPLSTHCAVIALSKKCAPFFSRDLTRQEPGLLSRRAMSCMPAATGHMPDRPFACARSDGRGAADAARTSPAWPGTADARHSRHRSCVGWSPSLARASLRAAAASVPLVAAACAMPDTSSPILYIVLWCLRNTSGDGAEESASWTAPRTVLSLRRERPKRPRRLAMSGPPRAAPIDLFRSRRGPGSPPLLIRFGRIVYFWADCKSSQPRSKTALTATPRVQIPNVGTW